MHASSGATMRLADAGGRLESLSSTDVYRQDFFPHAANARAITSTIGDDTSAAEASTVQYVDAIGQQQLC